MNEKEIMINQIMKLIDKCEENELGEKIIALTKNGNKHIVTTIDEDGEETTYKYNTIYQVINYLRSKGFTKLSIQYKGSE